MTIHCTAIYENGVLRPRQAIALPDGTEVHIAVTLSEPPKEAKSLAEVLAEIAAMPMETHDPGFSGSNHDQVLAGP
jgi:predicted DNA-binding antitoxin AbrB/MazE fold protein